MTTPSPGTFQFLHWDGPDRVTFGFHDAYYSANVTRKEVVPADGPTPYPSVPGVHASAAAPDGARRLALRQVQDGHIAACTGPPVPSYRVVGADLLDEAGAVLHAWGSGNVSHPWWGTIWGNGTHGFVWEHGPDQPPAATTGQLSVVAWSTGSVDTTTFDVPAGHAWRPYGSYAPDVVEPDQLLLTGSDGVLLVDPRGPTARAITSPLPPGGGAQRDGDAVVFTHWEYDTADGDRVSVARVRIVDGEAVWQVAGSGGPHGIVPRGVALVDDEGGRLLRWRDGVALPAIALGADAGDFPVTTGPPVAELRAQGDFIAIGIRGPQERLLVLGPDLEVLLSASPFPEEDPSTAGTPERGGNDVLDVPLAPTLALAAIALAALASRRRL